MWSGLNQSTKNAWPSAHALLKSRLAAWMNASDPVIPVLKRIRGKFFWVHPRLLTTAAVDHEPHIYQWIQENLPRRGVLFDVGAHYGWISLHAAVHAGREGRVIAFEASPVLIDLLRYHQRRNRLPQMTVIDKAVSDTDDRIAEFHLLNGGLSSRNSLTIGRASLPFLDAAEKTPIGVSTLQLDTFCERTGLIPNVIKIDVEGAEAMVLRGASSILTKCHPAVILSVHPYWLPPGDAPSDILASMDRYGYRVQQSHLMHYEGYEIGDYLFLWS